MEQLELSGRVPQIGVGRSRGLAVRAAAAAIPEVQSRPSVNNKSHKKELVFLQ